MAILNEEQIESHRIAGGIIQKIMKEAFELVFSSVRTGKAISEYDVLSFITGLLNQNNMITDGMHPTVAVNEHAAYPFLETTINNSLNINANDRLLIDIWARLNKQDSIYYDITWCGFTGEHIQELYEKLFNIAVNARNKTKQFVIDNIKKRVLLGCDVDKVSRDFVKESGYGEYYLHKTGHSIGTNVHSDGAHFDNGDTREIYPCTCFSIEPGIYFNDIGVRSEINIIINSEREVISIGEEQSHLCSPQNRGV